MSSIRNLLREGLNKVNEIVNGDYIVYHGSPHKIAKFSDDFVGRKEATDQNGPGIYFTTSEDEARGYAGAGGYVYKVKLHVDKLLESTEASKAVLNKLRDEVSDLIMMAPNWKESAEEFGYGDAKKGLETMLNGFIEYNSNEKDVFLQTWIDVYRDEPIQYVRNMVRLGYEGVIITPEETQGGTHIVLYNPNLIEFLSVEQIATEEGVKKKVVKETRMDASNISDSLGLFVLKNKIILYDLDAYGTSDEEDGILGVLTLGRSGSDYTITMVVAKKGYGPLMYELGMQHVSPAKVVSDRDGDTREDALNVWAKFIGGASPNVTVETLKPNDDGYVECLEFGCDKNMPEFFRVYNSKLSMTDTSTYDKLKAEGLEFLEDESESVSDSTGKDQEDVKYDILDKLSDYSIGFIDYMYR